MQLGINEIGVSFPDDTFGKESRFGIPFTVRAFVVVCLFVRGFIFLASFLSCWCMLYQTTNSLS